MPLCSTPTSAAIPIYSISIDISLPSHPPSSFPSSPAPISNAHPMLTRSKAKHPLCLTVSSSILQTKPLTVKEALESPVWVADMQEEYQAFQRQGTWDLVPFSSNQVTISCKWVFMIKRNSNSTIARYKARLVAKGYLQQEGTDFQEIFSPVAKQPTIRIILCLALHFQWPIKQLDISNDFLYGKLEEEVYMLQPLGFV
ncbi:unnamed protein product [Camellia sinensis]